MEKLYNQILLDPHFMDMPSDAEHVPYLESKPDVIDVSVGRQLFVDDFLIEKTELHPQFHRACKYEGNPVFFPCTTWETEQAPVACPKSGGVWYDEKEQIFKMWYEACWLKHMAYAVSKDGIHWQRPDLGIVPGTNLILPYEGYEGEKCFGGLAYLRPDSSTVWIDDTCDLAQRYKLFLRNPGGESEGIVATSADGLHFENYRFTGRIHDRSTVFYNPFRKKWIYSIRTLKNAPEEPAGVMRCRRYRECDDYLAGADWSESDVCDWLCTDELDKPDPYIGIHPHLYNVDCVGYESLMLGMFQIFYGPENAANKANGVPKITELQPMFSRDGYHFSRIRQPLIQASRCQGTWDRGYVQSVGGVCVICGDELWIYYAGFGGDEAHAGESDWTTNGMYRNGATGLAKLRRDGFVSMDGCGTLLTRPLTCSGKYSVILNAKGSVRTEILTADGQVLAAADFTGDATGKQLSFGDFDVSSVNGTVFRLRFCVDGELYAFGFADETGGCGGAHAAGVVQ